MKFSELRQLVNQHHYLQQHRDQDVVVAIKSHKTTIGPIPSVPVKTMQAGFDWESGMFIIHPESTLQLADLDYIGILRELVDEYSRLAYENRNLKAEIKKLKGKSV